MQLLTCVSHHELISYTACLAVFSLCAACRRTLADIIMEKITEKQTEVGTVMSEVSGCPMPQLDPRIIEVYRGVGKVSYDGNEEFNLVHCFNFQGKCQIILQNLEEPHSTLLYLFIISA